MSMLAQAFLASQRARCGRHGVRLNAQKLAEPLVASACPRCLVEE